MPYTTKVKPEHASLYCGTMAAYPVSACSAGRRLHTRSLPAVRDGDYIPGLCLQREMAVAYTFSFPIPSAFLCLCYYLPYPYLHGTVKPEHASLVPRYRSKWQDHVGTSALRCRPLASYVPLCSDLSGSASCTAPCIAGRQLHIRSLHAVRDDGCIPGLSLYCGTAATYPVTACSAGRQDSHNMA